MLWTAGTQIAQAELKIGRSTARSPSSSSTPDGSILSANENFCRCSAMRTDESSASIIACLSSPHYAQSEDYRAFWRN